MMVFLPVGTEVAESLASLLVSKSSLAGPLIDVKKHSNRR
jgi:hypothetical protein